MVVKSLFWNSGCKHFYDSYQIGTDISQLRSKEPNDIKSAYY